MKIARLHYGMDIGVALFNDSTEDTTVAYLKEQMPLDLQQCLARVRSICGDEIDLSETAFAIGSPDSAVVEYIIEMCRVIRNGCVEPRVQLKYVDIVSSLVMSLPISRRVDENSMVGWANNVNTMVQVVLQSLANICVNNEAAKHTLFNDASALTVLSNLLHLKKSSFVELHYIMALVHTCVVDSFDRCNVLSSCRDFVVSLLQCVAVALTELEGEAEHVLEFHARCVWTVGALVNFGFALNIFKCLEHDQASFLPLLSLWMGYRLEEEDELEDKLNLDLKYPKVSESLIALEEYFAHLVLLRDDVSMHEEFEGDTFKFCQYELLVVRLLGSYSTDARYYLLDEFKGPVLEDMVHRLDSVSHADSKYSYGLRGDLLRVISNVCFNRRCNQDAVRNSGNGLFVVLNQCNVDENSPYLREWSILAIRNLCENNLENQQAIANLRIEGTVNSSVIEKAGMKIEMSPDGKPKLVRI